MASAQADSNVIRSLWIGDSLSTLERLSIQSFLSCGHTFQLFTYGPVGNVPPGALVADASLLLPKDLVFKNKSGSYAIFSDLFRYKMLHVLGGWWVDLDIVCLNPFKNIGGDYFASERVQTGGSTATNAVMHAEAGSDLMRGAFEILQNLPDLTGIPWGVSGPYLINQLIDKFGLTNSVAPPQTFCPLDWWQFDKLLQPGDLNPIIADATAIHLWNDWWRRTKTDKNDHYPGTPYGALIKRVLN